LNYEERPVLLIDDIDAELDRGRIEAVLSELESRVQTFVSTSRRAIATRYRDRASIYLVELGKTIRETSAGNQNSQSALDGKRAGEPAGTDGVNLAN
jgi:hypothetical protein